MYIIYNTDLFLCCQERWKLKQEQNRIEALQRSLQEERRLSLEQQARDKEMFERTRVRNLAWSLTNQIRLWLLALAAGTLAYCSHCICCVCLTAAKTLIEYQNKCCFFIKTCYGYMINVLQ